MPVGSRVSERDHSYAGFLQLRELTALQRPFSDPPHHDEMMFVITHQVYELWFKELLHEIDAVIRRLDGDEVQGATELLRRCCVIEHLLVAQVGVLETMTPMDFLAFRDQLYSASGFDSSQFREIEFVSGTKSPRFLESHAPGSPERARLEARLAAPTVGDAFYRLLRRRGFDLPEPGEGSREEAVRAARQARVRELARLYRERDRHLSLYLLAEGLIEYDQLFMLWRLRHAQMAERIIGGRPGTGGSEGRSYLRSTADRPFFPDLWDLRDELCKPPPAGAS
jgi:tryptophan 2,3-dioxygenase